MNKVHVLAFALAAFAAGASDFTPDGMSGAAIQKAIDAANAAGGGRVALRPGVYPSGTIYLRSKVELHVPEGAVILGADKPDAYDDVEDKLDGLHPEKSDKVFISCVDCEDVSITGAGVIDGQGVKFYDVNSRIWGRFFAKPPHPRPRMIQFFRCRNVRLDGVTLKDSPGWTCWFRGCENLEITGVKIYGDQRMINNDGIDVDSCRHVRIKGCDIRSGDDCVVMRAMPPRDDRVMYTVCEDVLVEDCTLDSACQCIRLGCPSDGTIRRILFRNLKMRGHNGFVSGHPKAYLKKGDGGRCSTEDVRVENCDIDVTTHAVSFYVDKGIKLRNFGDVTFRHVRLKSGRPIRLSGTAETILRNMRFEHVSGTVAAESPFDATNVEGLAFDDFSVTAVPASD